MARKPLELPPEVGRSFMADLRAFYAEDNPIKRDEIAAHQVRALNEHRRPRDPKVRLADVKRLFELMRNSRNPWSFSTIPHWDNVPSWHVIG